MSPEIPFHVDQNRFVRPAVHKIESNQGELCVRLINHVEMLCSLSIIAFAITTVLIMVGVAFLLPDGLAVVVTQLPIVIAIAICIGVIAGVCALCGIAIAGWSPGRRVLVLGSRSLMDNHGMSCIPCDRVRNICLLKVLPAERSQYSSDHISSGRHFQLIVCFADQDNVYEVLVMASRSRWACMKIAERLGRWCGRTVRQSASPPSFDGKPESPMGGASRVISLH